MCCSRIELPVLQTVAESLRDVFELDALDARVRERLEAGVVIGAGVPVGAMMPCQAIASKPG